MITQSSLSPHSQWFRGRPFQPIPYKLCKSYTDYSGPEAEFTKCSHPPCPENDANIHDQDDDDNNDENPGGSLPPSRAGCPPPAKHQRPRRSHCQALLHGIFKISLSLSLSLSFFSWRWTMWRTRQSLGSDCQTIGSSPTASSLSPQTRWSLLLKEDIIRIFYPF